MPIRKSVRRKYVNRVKKSKDGDYSFHIKDKKLVKMLKMLSLEENKSTAYYIECILNDYCKKNISKISKETLIKMLID